MTKRPRRGRRGLVCASVLLVSCPSDDDGDMSGGATSSDPTASTSESTPTSTASTTGPTSNGSSTSTDTTAGDTDPVDPNDPACQLDDTCVDPRPSTCGDGVCDPTDHCDPCPEDCGACPGQIPAIARGPYLQRAAPDQIVVMWRTQASTDSAVAFGPAPDDLRWVAYDPTPSVDHEVVISGLYPATRYYYGFGQGDATLLGKTAEHHFTTFPSPGTEKPTRIWMLGDSGAAGAAQQAVRDGYLAMAAARPANLWLMLGDNAYPDGTDGQHQVAVFAASAFANLLRNTVVWPTIGNHERVGDNGDASPYFSIFSLPTQAESGGVASSTEYYYSFDYGQLHLVCLDSDTLSDSPAAMSWLRSDLEANDKRWLIAFWHHPPYSNGSHNSDDEGTLVAMRENFLPILEEFGVDLVFTGHSHSYERSLLLYGHYGDSSELAAAPQRILDASDGNPDGDGAYAKVAGDECPDIGIPLAAGASCGAVYTVIGSSSIVQPSDNPQRYDGGPLHPAMHTFTPSYGSVIVDIDGDAADVIFLDHGGGLSLTTEPTITDAFRLTK